MTPQERRLWYCFLKTYPCKFYRQRIIDRYIVDFYCAEARLVVELDGSQHYSKEGMEYDAKRTEVLEMKGLKVLRFTNSDIDLHFQQSCETIDICIKAQKME